MDHSLAVKCWADVWLQPVLDLLTSSETSRGLKSRLSDVRSIAFSLHHYDLSTLKCQIWHNQRRRGGVWAPKFTHLHTHLTALFRDYTGKLVPER